jgi:hypothetical protein
MDSLQATFLNAVVAEKYGLPNRWGGQRVHGTNFGLGAPARTTNGP